MLEGFFVELKGRGVPVSLTEWMTLQDALDRDLAHSSLNAFYYLARSVLVKSETFFDRYDRAFQSFFRGIESREEMVDEILKAMEKLPPDDFEALARQAGLDELSLEEVLKNFREQFEEGHFKDHFGGNRAIGRGGTSTQGAFGYNPAGVRIGQGHSRHRSAIQIAEMRKFRSYDPDLVLDTRQLRVALNRLRRLLPKGPKDELDLDETIDQTCRNAGELELIFTAPRRNTVKLLLLMDAGGSMTPYSRLVSRLFSAARSQFGDLKYYYFHNCIYDDLWTNMESSEEMSSEDLLKTYGNDYKVVLVGDANMAPSELLDKNGAISYYYLNKTPGIWWLYRVATRFPASVWLNPEPGRYWRHSITIPIVARIFPMFPLTLSGLDDAIQTLLTTQRPRIRADEIREILEKRRYPFGRSW